MPISKFKATCLAVLEDVRRTGRSIVVTRRGVPVAEVIPPSAATPPAWLGMASGSGRVVGDIVSPVAQGDDWESLAP